MALHSTSVLVYDPVLAGIVRILDAGSQIVGTGFLVSHVPAQRYGLIVTSTETVELATSIPIEVLVKGEGKEKIRLIFHMDAYEVVWEASILWWTSSSREDICVLKVEGTLPKQIRTLPLSLATPIEGRKVAIFGYPTDTDTFKGAWRFCEICKPGPRHLKAKQFFLQLSSSDITVGYRGAPVWDDTTRRVIGMVSHIGEQDIQGTITGDAYAIPVELLQASYQDVLLDYPISFEQCIPYRGLQPFREEDAAFFFGYEAVINLIVSKLQDVSRRFLAVFGPPSSGKTSVIQAGLFPRVRHGEVHGNTDWGIFVTILSQQDPFAQLEAEGLVEASQHLKQGLHHWCQWHQCQRLVLVLDQFEKLLRTCPFEIQERFMQQLCEVVEEGMCCVILIVQDGFYNLLARHEKLMRWVEENLVNVFAPHTKDALLNIARKRVHLTGAIQDEQVITQIVDSAIKKIDQQKEQYTSIMADFELSLQETAMQQQDSQPEKQVNVDVHQERIGDWAEHIFFALTEQEQALVKRLCLLAVHPGDERLGIPDLRKVVQITQICHDEAEYHLINRLADKGLFATDRDRLSGEATVTLTQDKILQEWIRLRHWIEEERQFLLWHQTFHLRLSTWLSSSDDPQRGREEQLLQEPELAEAELWQKRRPETFDQQALNFLWACQQRQHRVEVATHLAKQAALTYDLHPSLLQLSVLLAGESIARAPMPDTDQFLRRGLALSPRLVTTISPSESIQLVSFSQSGRYVAFVVSESIVKIADLSTEQICFFRSYGIPLRAIAFNPEGTCLAVADADGAVQLWYPPYQPWYVLYQDTEITHLQFSSNGRHLVVFHRDKTTQTETIRIWECHDWQQAYCIKSLHGIQSSSFSADGQLLAVGSQENTVSIVDLSSLKHFDMSVESIVSAVALSLRGLYLAIAYENGIITVSQIGKEALFRHKHKKAIRATMFSPTGNYLVTASEDTSVAVWDIPKGRKLRQLAHQSPVTTLAFSADGHYLATVSEDQTIRIWEIPSGHEWMRISSEKQILGLVFSPDRRYLFVADREHIHIWDLMKSKACQHLHYRSSIRSLAWKPSSDDLSLAVGCDDRSIHIWRGGHQPSLYLKHIKTRGTLVYSPDGLTIASSEAHTVNIWDALTGRQLARWRHEERIRCMAFSFDGRFLATGDEDHMVRIWDRTTRQEQASFHHSDIVTAIAVSGDSQWLVSGSRSGEVALWEYQGEGNCYPMTPSHKKAIDNILLSPNSQYLITASDDGLVRVWIYDQAKATHSGDFPHGAPIRTFCLIPDRSALATVCNNHLYLWELATGSLRFKLPLEKAIQLATFSPDGSCLAIASSTGDVSLWEVTSGRYIAQILPPSDVAVRVLAFHPDGSYLAIGCSNGDVSIWLWRSTDLLKEACIRVTRSLTLEEWKRYVGDEPYKPVCTPQR